MFIGHYAVAFGARGTLREKRQAPSLGTWFLAVQWLDLVWPFLVLAGVEHLRISPTHDPFLNIQFTDYPWTHSLLAAILWGLLFAAVYHWRTRDSTSSLWLALGVVSHWVLDLVVHIPDLPLYPGSAVKVGFGLWRSPAGTLLVEGGMFVAAVVWFAVRTRASDAVGRWALWGVIALLAIVYAASLLGPPPQSEVSVGASALLLWLLVPLAYWLDRHRLSSGP